MFESLFSIYDAVEPPRIDQLDYSSFLDVETEDNISDIDFSPTTMDYYNLDNPLELREPELVNTKKKPTVFVENTLPELSLLKLDIEDLFKLEGITKVNGKAIKFGDKNLRTSNIGSPNSWHKKRDPHTGNSSARDISIVGGTIKDYEDLKLILLNNNRVRQWMSLKKWGIINEVTPEILSLTKGTGLHFHFGPDTWAINTWNLWLKNPLAKVTTSFKNKGSSQTFTSNSKFAKTLNDAYKKALSERGLDPSFSTILVAQDANESGWGKKIKGNYNYGNITAGKNEAWHNRTGDRKWRDFSSIEDYVNGKIDFLSRPRYNFFKTFSPKSSVAVIMLTLANRGYDPGNPRYGINIQNTHNTLMKYLA